MRLIPHLLTVSLCTGIASAQILNEDDCANSANQTITGTGTWTFDTGNATTGIAGQNESNCDFFTSTSVSEDIWFTWTATSDGTAVIDTCASASLAFDTKMAIWPGTPGCPMDGTSITCNDDACGGFFSQVLFPCTSGTSYVVQLGHYPLGGAIPGDGTLTIDVIPPPTPGCVDNWSFETGDLSGWNVADIAGPFLATSVVPNGTTQGFNMFSITPTEGGFALQTGFDGAGPGTTTISQDVQITSGLTPLTFDYRLGWDYNLGPLPTMPRTLDFVVRPAGGGAALQTTNVFTADILTLQNLDTGPLSESIDLSMFVGQTVQLSFEINIPEAFTGPGYLQLDNISCPAGGGAVGTNYCAAAMNSTGMVAEISGSGSASATANMLTIECNQMPTNSFAYFLTSQMQGFVAMPGGSMGNLCLGGAIGRYVGPGQIQNSGASGSVSLMLDLMMHPTPTGPVQVMPGETWNFTTWFRDAVGGQATSNFSNGLEVTFI